jgi:dihydrofolate reductase
VVSFGEEIWPYGERAVWVWSRIPEDVFIPKCRRGQAFAYSLSPERMTELAKDKGYSHIYIDGGTTIQAFRACGFVDEYVLSRLPLLLGGGKPLFENSNAGSEVRTKMEHLGTKSFSNGIVQSHYRVKRSCDHLGPR